MQNIGGYCVNEFEVDLLMMTSNCNCQSQDNFSTLHITLRVVQCTHTSHLPRSPLLLFHLILQEVQVPKALQIKVNENHVFGIFFNSSTSGLYIEKGDSGYKNGMSLSRTCAKSTNDETFLFTFDTANL